MICVKEVEDNLVLRGTVTISYAFLFSNFCLIIYLQETPKQGDSSNKQEIYFFTFLMFLILFIIFLVTSSSSSTLSYSCFREDKEERGASCVLEGFVELSRLWCWTITWLEREINYIATIATHYILASYTHLYLSIMVGVWVSELVGLPHIFVRQAGVSYSV